MSRLKRSIPDMNKFKTWLRQGGANVLNTTNEYEAVRWKGAKTGVIYKSGKANGDYAYSAMGEYQQGIAYTGGPTKTSRMKKSKKRTVKQRIAERDGTKCWFCLKEMEVGEMTLEHLIPVVAGGSNHIANTVLAHSHCNNEAGTLPLIEKIDIRVKNLMKGK